MAKLYRKRPVVIEAEQWDGLDPSDIMDWVKENSTGVPPVEKHWAGMYWKLFIKTLEGRMEVSPGDYVIRGIQGEFYPVKPEIFLATYEAVL